MGNDSQEAVGMPDGVQDSHGLLMLELLFKDDLHLFLMTLFTLHVK